jgi:hypothetical protein
MDISEISLSVLQNMSLLLLHSGRLQSRGLSASFFGVHNTSVSGFGTPFFFVSRLDALSPGSQIGYDGTCFSI